jgi:hypothetical protein
VEGVLGFPVGLMVVSVPPQSGWVRENRSKGEFLVDYLRPATFAREEVSKRRFASAQRILWWYG